MSQQKCIFCNLLAEKTHVLYENETLFVLADKFPLSRGHLLVIPKRHAAYLHELCADDLRDVFSTIQKLVIGLEWKKYNLLQNNEHIQSVKHVHFHVVPCLDEVNQLKVTWKTQTVDEDYVETVSKKVKALFSE